MLAVHAATMLSTATPLAPESPTGPSWFDWLSDVALPTLVGVGSVAAAIIVATKSNRIAKASTAAANRSNAIARRAIMLEEQRDQRAADADARTEREAFRARWEAVLLRLAHELQWGANDDVVSKTSRQGAQLITEAEVREFNTPHNEAMRLIRRAQEANGGDILFMQASAAAHALMHDWVRSPEPDRVETAVQKWSKWMDAREAEHADDLRRGLPT